MFDSLHCKHHDQPLPSTDATLMHILDHLIELKELIVATQAEQDAINTAAQTIVAANARIEAALTASTTPLDTSALDAAVAAEDAIVPVPVAPVEPTA